MSKLKNVVVSQEEILEQNQYMQKATTLLAKRYRDKDLPLAHVHSYGCQQNVNDGEKIKGMLAQMGYGFCDSPDSADLVIYNTCAVRENAEDRVFGNVGALKHNKKRNPNMIIGLCGCMMQQQHIADKIKNSYSHVDIVFGTHALHHLPQIMHNALIDNKRIFEISQSDGVIAEGLPIRHDGTIKANLPIMYGCNNFCTYCIVPFVRGRERSRNAEDIIQEAKKLVSDGYKEITLLGQNVNSYGNDLEDGINFAELLKQLNAIDGDFWIRFMTSHPKDCSKELVDMMADCQKVCNHIHLPVQSGSDRVLKLMNRKYTSQAYLELAKYAKEKIPNLSLTSDIIVGFPGEEYEDFCQTLDLIKKVEYNSLFTFIYSKRVGTKAAEMPDNVSKEQKGLWFRELLAAQQIIGSKKYGAYVGKRQKVLVEGEGKIQGNITGRNEASMIVDFVGDKSLVGSFVDVKIIGAKNSYLIGELEG
ncbi:MAG: miaB [Oscillospiraceae bacterium]|nr:miaB [Oscillospiraceae bacterium]